jgi:hypothetical protein
MFFSLSRVTVGVTSFARKVE